MEHTKGKIETKEEDHQHVGIYPENNTNCLAVVWSDDMFNAEANAKELVRRWNAFEKDGLVNELLTVCKAVKIRIHFIGLPSEPMNENGTDWSKEIALIEAAITKCS